MKTLIVSRFNEDLDWLYKVKDWKIALYNKGQDINLDCIKLPNVGREAETYLNFIVNNYDTLKGIYAFFQGYPYGHGLSNNENKKRRIRPHRLDGTNLFGNTQRILVRVRTNRRNPLAITTTSESFMGTVNNQRCVA